MRVIAGSARRLLLKTIERYGYKTYHRPDQGNFINMLNTQIPGCTFLDLFAGSGAIGIEALSGVQNRHFL